MRPTTRRIVFVFLFLLLFMLFFVFFNDKDKSMISNRVKTESDSLAIAVQFDEKLLTTTTETTTTIISITTTTNSPVTTTRPVRRSVNWDAIAECEASGNWATNTGNGYYGGLQMNMLFWNSYSTKVTKIREDGSTYTESVAPRPDLASKDEQILAAERAYKTRGLTPWPNCGRYG